VFRPVTTTFIGIDLAWGVDRNHTGMAVLRGDQRGARLASVGEGVVSLASIVEFVREHSTASTVVAVDAPLVVTNATGFRECEREIGRRFGRFHASCLSNNLTRTPQPAGVRLVEALAPLGFQHDFDIATAQQRPGRWLFEVYPHPAMVVLFDLEQIIKYKKGSVAQRRLGLWELQRRLGTLSEGSCGLIANADPEELLARDVARLRGSALKRYENTLDALFCAYLAWHCWRWGAARNEMFGTLENGYIVVPRGAGDRADARSGSSRDR
jgi:predicted RNase H-like nuclease